MKISLHLTGEEGEKGVKGAPGKPGRMGPPGEIGKPLSLKTEAKTMFSILSVQVLCFDDIPHNITKI